MSIRFQFSTGRTRCEAAIRRNVAPMTKDRPLAADVEAVAEMVREGIFTAS